MINTFNTFPQDISEAFSKTVTISNVTAPTEFRSAISTASELLNSAKRQADNIIEMAKKEAINEVEIAKRQGFHEGFTSALKMFSDIQRKNEEILKSAEERALGLALEATKQITGEIIKQEYRQIISRRIKDALSVFSLQSTVKIKLNSDDYKILSAKVSEIITEHEQTIEWQATDAMQVGSFEISAVGCKLEADIDKQLDGIINGIINYD